MKEQDLIKDSQQILARVTATRDQFKMFIQEHEDLFRLISQSTDEQITRAVQKEPSLFRFMACAIVHEADMATVSSLIEQIKDERPDNGTR